jgi:hypothetical protein
MMLRRHEGRFRDFTSILKAVATAEDDSFEYLYLNLAKFDPLVDFIGSDLSGVDFGSTDVSHYDFTNADLSGADFRSARGLESVILDDAVCDGVQWPDGFSPSRSNFRTKTLPAGWRVLKRAMLERIRSQPPEKDAMIAFFDGGLPTWRLALAPGVRPRAVAKGLADRLRAAHSGSPKPLVLLLAGAGGEGKSTVLLHAAAALVEDERQNWTCLHRGSANGTLPEDLFAALPEIAGHAWLVVIDDAESVGHAIIAAMRRLAPRTDVHLLLAAREADWRLKRLVPGFWEPVAQFQQVTLPPLDQVDARSIVGGWCTYGDEAMGRLRGATEERASTALLGHARDLAARKEEGALLGALLFTRQGEDMRAHVRTLLGGLAGGPVVGRFSLREIYTMIAAMHAENQLYLSRSVLAFALGCEQDVLERNVLDVLRREATLDPGDRYVLTRHRRIAEAACKVLREDRQDVDGWYAFLARAARRDFRVNHTADPNISDWTFGLAEHFVEKGEGFWTLARNVAQAVYEAETSNVHCLTAYARVLRRTGQAGQAMNVLKAAGPRFRNRSDVPYEWGTVAGAVGDHGLNAWLAGRSLADGGTLDGRQCKLALAGLGVAFRELFAATGNGTFAAAQAACGQLGLRLPEVDARTRGYFERYVAEGRRHGAGELSPERAVAVLREAVVLGAAEVEPENDPAFFEELLGDPEGYRYTALSRIVGGGGKPEAGAAGSRARGRPI